MRKHLMAGAAVAAAALVASPAAPATAATSTARYETVVRSHNLVTGRETITKTTTPAPKAGDPQPAYSSSSSGGGAIPGSPSNSGRGYVDVSTTYYTAWNQKLFVYHERVTWLWGYGVVAHPYSGYPNPPMVETYVTNISPTTEDKGEASAPPDYYYTYASNWSACNGCVGAQGRSGFVAERHRHMLFTVPVQGSQANVYPWLLARVHWDGTFTWKGYTG